MSKELIDWNPEDKRQWENGGKKIAQRNLWLSVFALFLAFAVWQIWSVVVVNLPEIGFQYSANQLFLLASLPALSGATLRIFYSFAVPIVGGRRWTALSTASLLIPALGIGYFVQKPDTSFSVMLILALLCGFGGGNFSSSMSNISLFFPQKEKGGALGINAGLGNLGVSAVQLVVPLIIMVGVLGVAAGEPQQLIKNGEAISQWTQNAAYIWVPFIVLSTLMAWFGMNDIRMSKTPLKEQFSIFKNKHNWLMCWLYIGTFGSFIGFSAAFPMLTKAAFPDIDPLKFAFLGPLIGAFARVAGGIISDKFAASKVTQLSFIMMIIAVIGVIFSLPNSDSDGNYAFFFASFMILFLFTGIGNGSVFAQAPKIFSHLCRIRMSQQKCEVERKKTFMANAKETAAVVGFMGAIGAYGGFIIPKAFGSSLEATGSAEYALWSFVGFYISCLVVNAIFYACKNSKTPC